MLKNLEHIFSSYAEMYSGTALIRSKHETLLSFAGGYAHRGCKVPNTLDTSFDTASVTKIFTAAAILQLVEAKKLRLEDRITDIINLEGTEISTDVKIKHLLTHTSGIADDADEESGEKYSDIFIDKPNYSIRNCADFLPQFVHKPPYFSPGEHVRYNNCAYVLLGLALEAITGMSYRDYVVKHIFQACGMEHSCFHAMDEVASSVAEGYISVTDENANHIRWKKNIYSYPPIGTADGGAYTTVGDLDIFIRAIMNNTLLSAEYSKMLSTPHCKHTRPHRLGTWRTGYAFEFVEDDQKNILCMYKEGINDGVEGMCSYYPQAGITVNLLSNQNVCLFDLHREIQNVMIRFT